MRCQVQLVIIKQLEHSKGQIKSYVPMYEPKSNIVQVNIFQNVPFSYTFIKEFEQKFFMTICCEKRSGKFSDKKGRSEKYEPAQCYF